MKTAVVFLALVAACHGRTIGVFSLPQKTPFEAPVRATLTDCGGADAIVRFNSATLTPDPVKYPGTIGLNLDLTFTETLPLGALLDMDMVKTGIFPISLPCIDGLGACTFDICPTVEANQEVFCQLLPTDETGACGCPIEAGNYISTAPVTMDLPDFGSIIGALLQGNYNGKISVLSPDSSQLLGCLDMTLRIENS